MASMGELQTQTTADQKEHKCLTLSNIQWTDKSDTGPLKSDIKWAQNYKFVSWTWMTAIIDGAMGSVLFLKVQEKSWSSLSS